jgi:hypothetical protein
MRPSHRNQCRARAWRPFGFGQQLFRLPNGEYRCGSVVVRHGGIDARVVAVFANGPFEAIASEAHRFRREAANVRNTFGQKRRHRSEFATDQEG